MKAKVNTNYCGIPKALLTWGGVEKDVFPELSDAQQKRIKKSYDLDMKISVPLKAIRAVFSEEWKENLKIRKVIRRLPTHRVTVPWRVPT